MLKASHVYSSYIKTSYDPDGVEYPRCIYCYKHISFRDNKEREMMLKTSNLMVPKAKLEGDPDGVE
jgi:hypothetical protein